MGKNPLPLILSIIPLGFLGLFFLYPLGSIILETFNGGNFLSVWGRGETWEIFWFTLWQALLSSLLTLVLALPMAYVLGRFKFKGRGVISALLVIPFVLPTLVVASAVLALQERFGLRGFLNQSIWAILLAHIFFNFALVARIVGNQLAYLDPRPELAARTLGATQIQVFFKITLPQIKSAILAATGLVFFFSFTSFGVILVLGGPARATLDTEIWRYAVVRIDFQTAAALAVLQLLVVGAMAIYNTYAGRSIARASLGVESRIKPKTARHWGIITLALTITSAILFLPLLGMVLESLAPGETGFGLQSYRELFGGNQESIRLFAEPVKAIWNSLSYAMIAMFIAVIVGVLGAVTIFAIQHKKWGRLLEPLFLIPLGVSSVILGFGYLISLDEPFDLRSSWLIVPLAHALIGMPFVLRPVLTQLRSVDERLRWSAMSLGANPFQIFQKIDLPMVRPAVLTGAGFSFAISLGEFGAASFLVHPDRPTIPLAIFRFLSQPGTLSYGQAMALATILMLLLGAIIFLIDKLGARRQDLGVQIL